MRLLAIRSAIPLNDDDKGRPWLFKAGEIKEITVMTIGKFTIAIASKFGGSVDDGNAATCLRMYLPG